MALVVIFAPSMNELTQTEQQKLFADLNSLDAQKVDGAIAVIKHKGNGSMLPHLLLILSQTENEHTVNALSQLLFDLKDAEALNVMIDHLGDERLSNIRVQMLAACWQSGLDTSHRLPDLLNVALEGDYMETLEVLTIIENWDGFADSSLLESEIVRFKDALSETDITEVEDLYLSILEVLKGFQPHQHGTQQ
jgi:hypothetical protein